MPRPAEASRRRSLVKRRIALETHRAATHCIIPGCGRLTMKAAREGLAPHHCRKHVEHRARHGSYWLKTYTAAELKPYLTAANAYVRLLAATDKFIAAAIAGLRTTLDEAGPVEIATRLKGMSATKRAKIGLARLRVAEVEPERILCIVLAVTAVAESNGHRPREFRTVQFAKAVHRLASGTGWVSSKKRAYPKSTGQVLRVMGRLLEKPCEFVLERHLPGVLAYRQRFGRKPKLS